MADANFVDDVSPNSETTTLETTENRMNTSTENRMNTSTENRRNTSTENRTNTSCCEANQNETVGSNRTLEVETDSLAEMDHYLDSFANADNDDQLEICLERFLINIVTKMTSSFVSVRSKAFEALTHVNHRVKNLRHIQLPMGDILHTYITKAENSFMKNFLLVYIKIGYPRLSKMEQLQNVSVLFDCAECTCNTEGQRDAILVLVVRTFQHFEGEQALQYYPLRTTMFREILVHLLDILLDVILMPYATSLLTAAPPCMSWYGYKRLLDGKVSRDLYNIKLGVLKYLSWCNLLHKDIYVLLLMASCDYNINIWEQALVELGRLDKVPESDEPSIIRSLYDMFLGDEDKTWIESPERKRKCADLRIMLKLLPSLTRFSMFFWPECTYIIRQCIREESANPRLKELVLQFASKALSSVPTDKPSCLIQAGPDLLKIITRLLWESEESTKNLKMLYEILGILINSNQNLIKYDGTIITRLLDDLEKDSLYELRIYVREAIMRILSALKEYGHKQFLYMNVLKRISSPDPYIKMVVAVMLHRVFDYTDVKSRLLLLCLVGDRDETVRKDAISILYEGCTDTVSRVDDRKLNIVDATWELPDFTEMVNYLHSLEWIRGPSINDLKIKLISHTVRFPLASYKEMITYLRTCLHYSCEPSLPNMRIVYPCKEANIIGKYLRQLAATNPGLFDEYFALIDYFLTSSVEAEPIECLLECVGTVPDLLAQKFVSTMPLLRKSMVSENENIRISSSVLYGTILAYGIEDSQRIAEALQKLEDYLTSKTSSIAEKHASLLSMSYYFQRKVVAPASMNSSRLKNIVRYMNSNNDVLAGAACCLIGNIGLNRTLPVPDEPTEDCPISKVDVVNKLFIVARNTKITYKIKKQAIEALGFLCIGDPDFPHRKKILSTILEKHKQTKEFATLMDFGYAVCLCILGQYSAYNVDGWHTELRYHIPKNADFTRSLELFDFLYAQIGGFSSPANVSPKSRLGLATWTMIFIKVCHCIPLTLEQLFAIQSFYIELIPEADDMLFYVVARALCALPRFCTSKEDMIQLAHEFKRRLLERPSESVSFYSLLNEFCNFADQLKDIKLIYHMVSFIGHSLTEKPPIEPFEFQVYIATTALKKHSEALVPMLYFQRFCPCAKMRSTMARIWEALYPDVANTVRRHFDAIQNQLFKNLGSKCPYTQSTNCLALTDMIIIEGQKFVTNNIIRMKPLLEMLYLFLESEKASVKTAAVGAFSMLMKHCVAVVNHLFAANDVAGDELLKGIIIPILETGIIFRNQEIQHLSIKCVISMNAYIGPYLCFYLPKAIPSVIMSVGNYDMYMEKFSDPIDMEEKDTQELYETLNNHPGKKFLDFSVNYCDAEVISKVMPAILILLKEESSFNVRIVAMGFIVNAIAVKPDHMRPYCGPLVDVLFPAVMRYNGQFICEKYNITLCDTLYISTQAVFGKFIDKIVILFKQDSEDHLDWAQSVAASALYPLIWRVPRLFVPQMKKLLPIIFFCQQDTDNEHDAWQQIGEQLMVNPRNLLTLHQDAVYQFLKDKLKSSAWKVKSQVGRTMGLVMCTLRESCNKSAIFYELLDGLHKTARKSGRFPPIYDALFIVCDNVRDLPLDVIDSIVTSMINACCTQKIPEKTKAIEATGKILQTLQMDYYAKFFHVVKHYALKSPEELSSDFNGATNPNEYKREMSKFQQTLLDSLLKSWIKDGPEGKLKHSAMELVPFLKECMRTDCRNIQLAALGASIEFVDKFGFPKRKQDDMMTEILNVLAEIIRYGLAIKKHVGIKTSTTKLLFHIIKNISKCGNNKLVLQFRKLFEVNCKMLSKEKEPDVALYVSEIKSLLTS